MKIRARRSFTTSSTPEAVFDFLADFRSTEIWDPGTVHCSLESGEVGAGAVYRNVSEFLGRTSELTYTTLVHEPSTCLHFQGENESFVGDDRLAISADGAGARVDYHATFELLGGAALATPLVAAYLPFLANKTVKQLKATLDALPARTP